MSAEVKKEIQLEIAHILFIDIVGYSKLSSNDQHAAVEELNQIARASEQSQRVEATGRLIKIPTGDGMALVFYTSPEAPAQCAVEISRALKEHPRLQVRMGIHSGPVSGVVDVTERANLAGAGINMAKRVMDCGDAGHILLSKHVAEDLEEYEKWRPLLHDLGSCEAKHSMRVSVVNLYDDQFGNAKLPRRFETVQKRRTRVRWAAMTAMLLALAAIVAGIAVFSRYRVGSTLAAPEKSIAVLPFENLSSDKENAYFADGIQDEILTRLSKIGELRVIARTSTLRYKTKPGDLSEIAKQLGVTNFLEGSVQKVGERVRINVQLIRAGANDHLWAEIYDRNLADIFAVQSEVATAIANTLLLKLTGHERTAVAQKPTDNLAAYDAYLRGLDLSSRPSQVLEDQIKAADQFEEAVRLDPRFAQAWAALSQVDSYLYILRQVAGGSQRAEMARSAAETATRLDPSSPETLLANAYYRYLVQRDYQSARVLFEEIHEQVPSNSQALVALARVARRQNRWKDSLRLFEEAAKLNPRDISLLTERAMTFTMLRQPAAAHEMIDRALAINPDDFELLVVKARLFQWESNLPAAKSVLDKLASTPQTDDVVAVQVDHLVLSRSYEEAETLLLGTLAKSGSRTDLEQANLRASLGRVQSLAGKKEKAQQTYLEAKSELEAVQREQATSPWVAGFVGSVEAGLGNKEAALREGERGVSLWPASEDPVYGPAAEENLAGIEALVDEPDRALALIERLVTTPYGSYPLNQAGLRLDPTWDRLRSHPRFKAIVEGPEPKTIYH